MNDLLDPFVSIPILIPVAELMAMIYLNRKRIKRRLIWIIGSYLIFVAFTLALALYPYKGETFGYNWIPFFLIAEPWSLLLRNLPASLTKLADYMQNLYGAGVSVLLNCCIFYLLSKVGYPKHSTTPSGQQAT